MLHSASSSRAASRHRRGLPIVAAAVVGCAVVMAVAACGSSDPTSSNNAKKGYPQALAFARCMRSHGVPNFPDPTRVSGGIQLLDSNSGINEQSPAFKSAQNSCKHLLPGGGPGSGHPTSRDRAQMLRFSQCMRRHGVTGFPDPTLSAPSSEAGYAAVVGRNGVFLAIPNTINTNSPAFKQAAAACGSTHLRLGL